MNKLKEERKAQAKGKNIKVKSSVQSIKEMQWPQDTGNPIVDTFQEYDTKVGGKIMIEGHQFDVRMPLRKLIKRYNVLSENYDEETDTLHISDDFKGLPELQEQIINDMIPDLDLETDEIRIDQVVYTNLSKFCWTFYRFFEQKSSVAGYELSGNSEDL